VGFLEASPADEAAGQGDEGIVEFSSADPPSTQLGAVGIGIVALLTEQGIGPATEPAGTTRDGRDAIDQGEGLGDVVDVGRGRDDLERGAASVADQAVSAAGLPPVDRRRTGVSSPSFARTWGPSTHARDQPSSPAAFSLASSTRWS
jgi:hypothetical protein